MTLAPCWTAYWRAWTKPDVDLVGRTQAEDLERQQGRTRGGADDPGPAPALGQDGRHVGVDVLREVVLEVALGGDGAGVAESLTAGGLGPGAVAGKVLVVDDHR